MLAHLGDVLGLPRGRRPRTEDQRIPMVILSRWKGAWLLWWTNVINEQELVIKRAGAAARPGWAGSLEPSVMGNGVALILQVSDLIELALRGCQPFRARSVQPDGATVSARSAPAAACPGHQQFPWPTPGEEYSRSRRI